MDLDASRAIGPCLPDSYRAILLVWQVSMENIKKIYSIALLCVLCVSTVSGEIPVPEMSRGARILSAINRRVNGILRRNARNSTRSPRRSSVSSHHTSVAPKGRARFANSGFSEAHIRSTPRVSSSSRTNTARYRQTEKPAPANNILSRPMQRKVAQEARPYLDELDWVRIPRQPASYLVVQAGIDTFGNLTRMSEEQYAAAVEDYKSAVQYTQEVAKSINAELYYLGTSEAEPLTSIQISRRLDEISKGISLVAHARITWGDHYTLMRAATYWDNMRQVYTIISTGIYHTIGKKKVKLFERTDGHRYVEKEFGLQSEGVKAEIPQIDWWDPSSWLSSDPQGVLPQRLRVAVLQDDRDVINALKEMKKKAGLRGWKLDLQEADTELFLQKGTYGQYDMILTDVLMKNGGGRYLARQLRSRGYEGIILTLSGFEETHEGKLFFNDGIDGMIDLGWTPNLTDRIWAKLNTYFILKKKYNWQH